MSTLFVRSVNSATEGSAGKSACKQIVLNLTGVENDFQEPCSVGLVSLIDSESSFAYLKSGLSKKQLFAENLTIEGLQKTSLNLLDRLQAGSAEIQIVKRGKGCNELKCNYLSVTKSCTLAENAYFARVTRSGIISAGDKVIHLPKVYKVVVVTLSDRASKGEYFDLSGPEAGRMISDFFETNKLPFLIDFVLLPDDAEALYQLITNLRDASTDLVITTGGTGIGPRDITPDVVSKLIDKQIPGIMELIRYKYGSVKPNALLSRSVAGVMGQTLIYTLPGSVKAVNEYLNEILPTLKHSIYMLNELDMH